MDRTNNFNWSPGREIVGQNGQKIGILGNERHPLVKCVIDVIKGYKTFTGRIS